MIDLTLSAVEAELDQLPALPTVAMELMQSMQNPHVEAHDIALKMSKDPVLVAKLLRVANSSFYGLQGQVESIEDALLVLGLRATLALVTAACVTRHFQDMGCFDQRPFWLHSAETAVCAQVLARHVGANPEIAFLSGLLHDIGHLVLAMRFPEYLTQVQNHRAQQDCRTVDAECAVLGFNHAQVGALLAKRWKFPENIVLAIEQHHHQQQTTAPSQFGSITHLADIMAHALEELPPKNAQIPQLSAGAWMQLGLEWTDFPMLLAKADAYRKEACLIVE